MILQERKEDTRIKNKPTHQLKVNLAESHNRIIVTQETSEPNRKNKIKIPDACNDLNVRFMNTMDMFRQLGETF